MSEPRRADLSPVILAGGSGTRLWPLSRRTHPKHLIALTGTRTLIQLCADRALAVASPERVITVGAVDQGRLIAAQLAAVDPTLPEGLILEPAARNTAAACCAAALAVRDRFGGAQILWVCAADHLMAAPDELYAAVGQAMEAAADGRLVTFGIEPGYPEPGFGYIEVGAPLAAGSAVRDVARFVEKPERSVAEAMLAAGGHLWNSGMFVFRADSFLEELATHAPSIVEATTAAMAAGGGLPFVPSDAYGAIPSAPVDKAVMEVSAKVAVVPCDPHWSDVGSWRAVWETLPQDAAGNATSGDVLVEGAERCLVLGGERLVAAVGVRDLAIIDTGDAVMVADRDDSAAVKAVVGRLQADARPEAEGYGVETTEWGERRQRHVAGRVVVSELVVRPGAAAVVRAAAGHRLHLFRDGLEGPAVVAPGEERRLVNASDQPQIYVEVATALP